jgi:putative spermidine/putrescine transport system ATP-binding protein
MNEGRIEQLGAPRDVYDAPATRFVAWFIGDINFIEHGGDVVAVRPERMRLSRSGDAGPHALEGEVLTTMVVGAAVQTVVRGSAGQELLVRLQRGDGVHDAELLNEGDRVIVSWADEAALAIVEPGRGGDKA